MRIRQDHFPYIEDADWAHLNRMYAGRDDAKLRAQKRKEWNARAKCEYEERWLAEPTLRDTAVEIDLQKSMDQRRLDAGIEDITVSLAEERRIGIKVEEPARLDARDALSSPSEHNVGKPMPSHASNIAKLGVRKVQGCQNIASSVASRQRPSGNGTSRSREQFSPQTSPGDKRPRSTFKRTTSILTRRPHCGMVLV